MKEHLRTNNTIVTRVISEETGEVIDENIVHNKYLAGSRKEFYMMYSSMILILKGSPDVRMKLFAALIERYAEGQEFSVSKAFKEILAKETGCSARSFDKALTSLAEDKIIVRLSTSLYKINPRHVFYGGSNQRDGALKAIIELGCKDC